MLKYLWKDMVYMAKSKYKNKSVFTKKLAITLGIIIGFIFIVLYFNEWQEVKEEEKYLNSYLMSTGTINYEMNDIKEISSVLSETPNYYFVYISFTKDKSIYNLEKKLKPIIDDYNLQNNFYYINVTDIKEKNKNYKKDIARELNINTSINKVPVILYFKDGKLVGDNIYNIKDFEKLLKEENIKSK